MNQIRRSLGGITPDQLHRANAQVDALAQKLTRQYAILREAETAGVDPVLLAELRATHSRLFAQLQSLTAAIPSLSTYAFEEWVARATSLEHAVHGFERQVQTRLPGAEAKRVAIIAVSTVGALAVAGGIAAVLWYWGRR